MRIARSMAVVAVAGLLFGAAACGTDEPAAAPVADMPAPSSVGPADPLPIVAKIQGCVLDDVYATDPTLSQTVDETGSRVATCQWPNGDRAAMSFVSVHTHDGASSYQSTDWVPLASSSMSIIGGPGFTVMLTDHEGDVHDIDPEAVAGQVGGEVLADAADQPIVQPTEAEGPSSAELQQEWVDMSDSERRNYEDAMDTTEEAP